MIVHLKIQHDNPHHWVIKIKIQDMTLQTRGWGEMKLSAFRGIHQGSLQQVFSQIPTFAFSREMHIACDVRNPNLLQSILPSKK